MKRRIAALALSLAMVFAIGAPAALAEGDEAEQAAARDIVPADGADAAEAENAETPGDAETEEAETPDAAQAPEADAPEELETSEDTPQEAPGSISFGSLRGRMMESYYPLLSLGENIKTIEEFNYDRQAQFYRDKMNDIAEQQWVMLQMPLGSGEVMYASLQAQYDAWKDALDDLKKGKLREDNESMARQFRNLQDQTVIVGETFYIALKELEASDASMTRSIAALDRTVRTMEVSSERGLVSALAVQQMKNNRTQYVSAQQTLRMNRDNVLLQLKAMTGVDFDAALSLAALPQVTAQELAAMNLTADLAKAKETSYEVYDAKKTYDDAKKDYDDAVKQYGLTSDRNEMVSARHTWQAAQYTYENAMLSYELKFRTLYAQVRDSAQVLEAKRSALALEEKNYAVSALKYEQGSISANALADAKDSLNEAKSAVAGAERDLFSQYRSYYWAVEYGILNS